jgi:hypothetical protein
MCSRYGVGGVILYNLTDDSDRGQYRVRPGISGRPGNVLEFQKL